jgi:hypothetical protein
LTEPDLRAGELFAAFVEVDRARWQDLISRAVSSRYDEKG